MKDLSHLMNKKWKTVDGNPARVIAVDRNHKVNGNYAPILILEDTGHWEQVISLYENLVHPGLSITTQYIIEVSPWEDFEVDEKVWVWCNTSSIWAGVKGYFAGISEQGLPMTYHGGKTSFTSDPTDVRHWNHCIRYEDYVKENSTPCPSIAGR